MDPNLKDWKILASFGENLRLVHQVRLPSSLLSSLIFPISPRRNPFHGPSIHVRWSTSGPGQPSRMERLISFSNQFKLSGYRSSPAKLGASFISGPFLVSLRTLFARCFGPPNIPLGWDSPFLSVWCARPLKNGTSHFTRLLLADPKVTLPAAFVNRSAENCAEQVRFHSKSI